MNFADFLAESFMVSLFISIFLAILILRFIIKVPTELHRKANALEYQNYLEYTKLILQNPNLKSYICPPKSVKFDEKGNVLYSAPKSALNKEIGKNKKEK